VQARPINPLFAGDVLFAERDAKVKRLLTLSFAPIQWRTEGGGFEVFNPHPPEFPKAL